MPREAHGTVVQLAESHGTRDAPELLDHVAERGPNIEPALVGRSAAPAADHGDPAPRRAAHAVAAVRVGFFAGCWRATSTTRRDVGRPGVARRRTRPAGADAGRAPGFDRLEVEQARRREDRRDRRRAVRRHVRR